MQPILIILLVAFFLKCVFVCECVYSPIKHPQTFNNKRSQHIFYYTCQLLETKSLTVGRHVPKGKICLCFRSRWSEVILSDINYIINSVSSEFKKIHSCQLHKRGCLSFYSFYKGQVSSSSKRGSKSRFFLPNLNF